MSRELLFSVTAADCEWSYTRGSGNGGQKKNKTSSAVHCMHRPSGAHGYSEESRSQLDNKRAAFVKMCNSDKFKQWHKMECMRRLGVLEAIDRYVDNTMKAPNLRLEIKQEGKWLEIPFDSILNHHSSMDTEQNATNV